MNFTLEEIPDYRLFETISGSRAYGLDTPQSDTDIRGVFFLPKPLYYSLTYTPQVSNETNDSVYYELGRFVELLCASNPSCIELLHSPDFAVQYTHPIFAHLNKDWFLSQTLISTLTGYAQGQFKKAVGFNKKILAPVDKRLKSVLEFCSVIEAGKTKSLAQWLAQKRLDQSKLGLAQIPHTEDFYALFVGEDYRGISNADESCVVLSRIPDNATTHTYLFFNKAGYLTYTRNYQDYWNWVKIRNEERYQQNLKHDNGYDSKNMMHTFRLLHMALDLATDGELKVWRANREELLAIKSGQWTYQELKDQGDTLIHCIESKKRTCDLPERVDKQAALEALITMRQSLYR